MIEYERLVKALKGEWERSEELRQHGPDGTTNSTEEAVAFMESMGMAPELAVADDMMEDITPEPVTPQPSEPESSQEVMEEVEGMPESDVLEDSMGLESSEPMESPDGNIEFADDGGLEIMEEEPLQPQEMAEPPSESLEASEAGEEMDLAALEDQDYGEAGELAEPPEPPPVMEEMPAEPSAPAATAEPVQEMAAEPSVPEEEMPPAEPVSEEIHEMTTPVPELDMDEIATPEPEPVEQAEAPQEGVVEDMGGLEILGESEISDGDLDAIDLEDDFGMAGPDEEQAAWAEMDEVPPTEGMDSQATGQGDVPPPPPPEDLPPPPPPEEQ